MKRIVAAWMVLSCALVGLADLVPLFVDTETGVLYSVTNSGGITNQIGGPNSTSFFANVVVSNSLQTTYGGEDDLRFPVTSVRIIGVGGEPSTSTTFGPSGDQFTLLFDDSTDNIIFFVGQMPHTWDTNSVMCPHVHWSPSTTATGNVVWATEFAWTDIGQVMSASTTYLTTQVVDSASQYLHILTEFPDIAPTNQGLSSMFHIRFYRDANNAGDTYGDDAALWEFDIHYEILNPGGKEI